MREEIYERFQLNIGRVDNLVSVYESVKPSGKGRKDVSSLDILRAATVFLHATLEEVLRGLIVWLYPRSGSRVLDQVPLLGTGAHGRAEKFLLGNLAAFDGQLVIDVIEQSVERYANSVSFNRCQDIAAVLQDVGVAPTDVNQTFSELEQLMSRRHQIVHQADKNPSSGPGQQAAQSIGAHTVRDWRRAVDGFVRALFLHLPHK